MAASFGRLPRPSPVACTISASRRIFPWELVSSRGVSSGHTLRAVLAEVSITRALKVRGGLEPSDFRVKIRASPDAGGLSAGQDSRL